MNQNPLAATQGTPALALEYDARSQRIRAVVMSEDVAIAVAFGAAIGLILVALSRR